jgi:hypothetical protein
MKFARWAFTLAGIYGLIVLTPLFFLEDAVARASTPISHPIYYYGFAGVALAFQVLFLLIGRDPARMRSAMIPSIIEKLAFPAAAWPLYLSGRADFATTLFATVDLALAFIFLAAWIATRPRT